MPCLLELNGSAKTRERTQECPYPADVRLTILSGADLYNFCPIPESNGESWKDFEYQRFVFDLPTLRFNDRLVIDFNHDEEEVIGAISSTKVENGELIGTGRLVPFTPGDRASEVAYKIQNGIPYGVSPLIAFDEAEAVLVPEGESIEVNGRVYEGGIIVYRNARILGAAICAYPTDEKTCVVALKKGMKMPTVKAYASAATKEDEKKKKSGDIDPETTETEEENLDADTESEQDTSPDAGGDETPEPETTDGGDETPEPSPDPTPNDNTETQNETENENTGNNPDEGGGGQTQLEADTRCGKKTVPGNDTGAEAQDNETEGASEGDGVGGDGEDSEGEKRGAGMKCGDRKGYSALDKEIQELKKENQLLREELGKLSGAVRSLCGGEPLGLSSSENAGNNIGYSEAISAQLDRIQRGC